MDLTDDDLERYARHIILKQVGGAGQKALRNARVLVIGAGGLGAPLLMYLAAAGVGAIGIIDHDHVSLSNLQRQIVHATSSLGDLKTASAARTLAAINPGVSVICHSFKITAENADEIISGYDIVAEGSDNFATRFAVNDACVRLKKTLVSAALSQFEGQLATFKPHAGENLPCYRCFVPDVPPQAESCAEAGILGAVAGVMGAWAAVEVLKEIIGIGDSLAGHLILYDALSARTRKVTLKRDPACPTCGNAHK